MNTKTLLAIYAALPPAYYDWMFDRIAGHCRTPVLELGTGAGLLTDRLLAAGHHVTTIDTDAELVARYQHNQPDRVTAIHGDMTTKDLSTLPGAPFQTVLCCNVLEHIDDDRALLANCRQALAPGGRLVLLVPAHPWLFGSMDERFGHVRRYSRHGVETLFDRLGLSCRLEWFNFLGIFGWWWRFRLWQAAEFSRWQTKLFAMLLPLQRRLEACCSPPIGLSIIAVGQEPP